MTNNKVMLKLCFLGIPSQTDNKYAMLCSTEIAPKGMHTDAWDWRMKLKKGDIVDCCDEYKCWY